MADNSKESPDLERAPERLGDAAYREMKERIIRGVYRPGHKLTVRAIAQDLEVSTTPARDAINRLTSEGALFYAGPKTVVVPVLDASALREITLTRLALEGLASEQAAQHGTPVEVEKLKSLQKLINSALDEKRYAEALWHNKEFHFTVYRLAGLPQLVSMIESLWLRIGPSLHNLYPEFAEEKYGVRNHEIAMEALAERDAASLRAAMENDIRDGYRRLKRANPERDAGQSS
ncbi:GntR family transcriptional regulator (plasmid) [Sinorhizobium meliloti]|uniref:GntR family transcriptional repressor RctR n=1 Tax=Rhizobium meliloti TaxID=382 RepID=UPI001296121C|nr:GntR family transcriptional regulator [Sinorhizobium meliloti]MDW9390831.1 FCD domain-containing protein [Sinorhizobium meliloti]MDW9436986.1 FCD domain-containing protein [Sinorhizobium meliloti]MDW9484292.1 FCD domain-containing protein [Sinorhizobium meliloti]MDW9595885.1 FCD domain-containing protein [Sinorhizobium meliloti]MDW9621086.1 FCD domain-containing protein [Sinorhizobium meliloti]